jgi:hypothetical protein
MAKKVVGVKYGWRLRENKEMAGQNTVKTKSLLLKTRE